MTNPRIEAKRTDESTEELVSRVRAEMIAGRPYVPGNPGHAALSILQARMERLEKAANDAWAFLASDWSDEPDFAKAESYRLAMALGKALLEQDQP